MTSAERSTGTKETSNFRGEIPAAKVKLYAGEMCNLA